MFCHADALPEREKWQNLEIRDGGVLVSVHVPVHVKKTDENDKFNN